MAASSLAKPGVQAGSRPQAQWHQLCQATPQHEQQPSVMITTAHQLDKAALQLMLGIITTALMLWPRAEPLASEEPKPSSSATLDAQPQSQLRKSVRLGCTQGEVFRSQFCIL